MYLLAMLHWISRPLKQLPVVRLAGTELGGLKPLECENR